VRYAEAVEDYLDRPIESLTSIRKPVTRPKAPDQHPNTSSTVVSGRAGPDLLGAFEDSPEALRKSSAATVTGCDNLADPSMDCYSSMREIASGLIRAGLTRSRPTTFRGHPL